MPFFRRSAPVRRSEPLRFSSATGISFTRRCSPLLRSGPRFRGTVGTGGLVLTLIHLVGIPVDNLSVNPARSIGPALVVGGWALAQLWMFWVAPIVGAIAGGWLYRTMLESHREPDIAGRP